MSQKLRTNKVRRGGVLTFGCLGLFVLSCVGVVVTLLFLNGIGNSIPNSLIRVNKTRWEEATIERYVIIVERGDAGISNQYRITVNNQQIVNLVIDANEIPLDEYVNYEQFTVQGLFEQADNCRFCNALFHPEYGFPTRISAGFIEGSITVVTDFQPLAEIEAIPED